MDWNVYFLCIMTSLFTETQSQIGDQGLCSSNQLPTAIPTLQRNETQSQIGDQGLCSSNQLPTAIPTLQRNVISVCTSSSSNTVNRLYFDMGSAPLQATSECYCIFTFQNEKSNLLNVELYAGNDQNITVEGFGQTITSKSTSKSFVIGTILQTTNLKFTVTTNTKPALACIQIGEVTNSNSSFSVRCFRGGENPNNVPSPGNQDTDNSDRDSGKEAIIGGVVGGIVLVIVVVVVVVVVYLRKRKQAANRSGDKEEYYMTENAMYNQPAGSLQRSTSNQPSINYEVVDAGYQNRGNDVYSEVIKNKESENEKKETADATNKNIDTEKETLGVQSKPEDEYNHLNELPKIFPTGNVYSSLGNRTIESNQDNLYNASSQSDNTRSNAIKQDTGNVYNTTTDGETT